MKEFSSVQGSPASRAWGAQHLAGTLGVRERLRYLTIGYFEPISQQGFCAAALLVHWPEVPTGSIMPEPDQDWFDRG